MCMLVVVSAVRTTFQHTGSVAAGCQIMQAVLYTKPPFHFKALFSRCIFFRLVLRDQ